MLRLKTLAEGLMHELSVSAPKSCETEQLNIKETGMKKWSLGFCMIDFRK